MYMYQGTLNTFRESLKFLQSQQMGFNLQGIVVLNVNNWRKNPRNNEFWILKKTKKTDKFQQEANWP